MRRCPHEKMKSLADQQIDEAPAAPATNVQSAFANRGEPDGTLKLRNAARLNMRLAPNMGNRVVAAGNFVWLHIRRD